MYSEPRSVFRWSQTIPECLNRQLGQLGQNCKKLTFYWLVKSQNRGQNQNLRNEISYGVYLVCDFELKTPQDPNWPHLVKCVKRQYRSTKLDSVTVTKHT